MHRGHKIHPTEPLLPAVVAGPKSVRISQRLLRRAGGILVVVLLLFIGHSYYRHYRVLHHHSLSSCPARLAALGLDLNAVAGDSARFVTSSPGSTDIWQHALLRRKLYDKMTSDLHQHGLKLGGLITQGLGQKDLFEQMPAAHKWSKPKVKALLHPQKVPIRAVVLPLLDHEAALQLHTAVRHALSLILADDSVWYQDETTLHSTLFHASTHLDPVPAAQDQVLQEVANVADVAGHSCPIRAVLDRVVVTSTGMVVACWQALPGSVEPAALRAALREALPSAPVAEKQVVKHSSILHTTVARLLAPAKLPTHSVGKNNKAQEVWDTRYLQQALEELMDDVSDELCGLTAEFDELWFVEEHDLLALGLAGKYVKHPSQLICPKRRPVK